MFQASLQPVSIMRAGAEEERSEMARMVSRPTGNKFSADIYICDVTKIN